MKHPPIPRLLLALLMALTATAATAYSFEVDGIYYYKNSDGASVSVTSGDNKYTGSVTIPSQVTYSGITYSVTSIGESAFSRCSGLTSVTIPNSVTEIGKYAFGASEDLTSVTIPNSVTEIGDEAFAYCRGLTSVTIPNSVTSIGESAFRGCSGLTSVTIGNSVTSIGDSAFEGCSGLTSVTIPNSVTSIGDHAFLYCSRLTSVTIPNSVTWIGDDAFLGTPFNNSLPNGVVYLGRVLYKYKGDMPQNTSISIQEGIVSISPDAFSYCSGLTSVTIPNSVTKIGDSAFERCTSLTSVIMSDALTYIGDFAFYNAPFINNLPNGAIYLGKCLFMYKGEMPENTSYSVPDGTTQVCSRAFYACRNLASITIPNSVTSIGERAFYGCINLKSAVIGNGATEIPEECFKGCVNLETIQFGSGVSTIGDNAFDDCSNATTIISGATTPPDLSYYSSHEELDPFKSVNKWTTTVYVPDGCVSAYQSSEGWKEFLYIMGNEDVSIDGVVEVSIEGVVLHCDGVDTVVYTLSGALVYSGNGDVKLAAGAYIVVANGHATKVVVK